MLIKVMVISETRNDDSLAPLITGFACTHKRTHLIIQVEPSVIYNLTYTLYPPSQNLNFTKQSKKIPHIKQCTFICQLTVPTVKYTDLCILGAITPSSACNLQSL